MSDRTRRPVDEAEAATVLARGAAAAAGREARALGFGVGVADLGDWGGRVRLCAEIDLRAKRIFVDARLLAGARRRFGDEAAGHVAALAIRHELAHAADPAAPEAAIRASIGRTAGLDADALVRDALGVRSALAR